MFSKEIRQTFRINKLNTVTQSSNDTTPSDRIKILSQRNNENY